MPSTSNSSRLPEKNSESPLDSPATTLVSSPSEPNNQSVSTSYSDTGEKGHLATAETATGEGFSSDPDHPNRNNELSLHGAQSQDLDRSGMSYEISETIEKGESENSNGKVNGSKVDISQQDHPLQSSTSNSQLRHPASTAVEESKLSRRSSPSTPPAWTPEGSDAAPLRRNLNHGWPSSPTPSTSALQLSSSSQDKGPSLAAHYLPKKFSGSLSSHNLDPRRSNSSARLGIASSSSSLKSPLMNPPTSISSRSRSKFISRDSRDRESRSDEVSEKCMNDQVGSPSKPPLSSSNRVIKRGAGRDAWGPDGAGEAALGAGSYEDDDGVDFDWRGNDGNTFTNDSDGIIASQAVRRRKSKINRTTSPFNHDDDLSGSRPSFLDTRLREKRGGGIGIWKIFRAPSLNGSRKRLKWNRFKWVLFLGNLVLTFYSLGGLVGLLLTWGRVWNNSEVVTISNRVELILGTVAASLSFVTSLIGWSGILLNNRSFLSIYSFMLWISFAFIVSPGYISYKRKNFNLEGKINNLWSRQLTLDSRKKLQDSLNCCGYYSPFIEAASTPTCYSRSLLPGCKGKLLRFERDALVKIYAIAFGLVPAHLALIIASLLCSNHITYRFGKGVVPEAYRLNASTAQVLKSRNEIGSSEFPTSTSRTRLISNNPTETSNRSSSQSLRSSDSMELNGSLGPAFGTHSSNYDPNYANTPLRNAVLLGSEDSSRVRLSLEDGLENKRGGRFKRFFKR